MTDRTIRGWDPANHEGGVWGYAIYKGDEVSVAVQPNAPDVLAVMEIPLANVPTDERDQALLTQKENQWLRGMMIIAESRHRNPAFDGPLERTTARLAIRPCRTQEEAKEVLAHIYDVLLSRGLIEKAPGDD